MAEPHSHPDHLWRNPEPKRSYEVVIIGAGGHGLATAYYLAKNHGISDVASSAWCTASATGVKGCGASTPTA